MRVFLSADALRHNPFIFRLLVAWGEPALPRWVVMQKELLLTGSVVPSPLVLHFSRGCWCHVVWQPECVSNIFILYFYLLALCFVQPVLPLFSQIA